MMSPIVAQDYSNTSPSEFPLVPKALLTLSILIPTTIIGLSLSQLGRESAYLAPITSFLTIIHATIVGFLCYRESKREPSFSPREPRSVATRRSNLVASWALYVLWLVTFVLLVIATARAAKWVLSPVNGGRTAVEAALSGVQACVTLVFAMLCTRDRQGFHRRARRQRWSIPWF